MPLRSLLILCLTLLFTTAACSPKINLIKDHSEPLEEYTLEGKGRSKILLVPVQGSIGIAPRMGLIADSPSLVHEVTARLRKAAEDKDLRAVLLFIDSPGGSVTASDILHQELLRFKQETGKPLTALLMGLAASGGYYAAAAADKIVAHPTTITGSIGTIFIRADLKGLMGKVGVEAEVTKSGEFKDISSWLRHSTPEERQLMQDMLDQLNARFLAVVQQSRNLTPERLQDVSDARVLTAEQARELGLVDAVGYTRDALALTAQLAGLDMETDKPRIVTYRRAEYADDTAYNTLQAGAGNPTLPFMDGAARLLKTLEPGFHYLWLPGAGY